MDEDEKDDGFTIIIDGYSDRTVGQGVKARGFQSYFKKIRKKRRILCYLPINGLLTKDAEWGAFYSQNRAGRTAGERGTKMSVYSYYQFVKKEPNNPSSFTYYYSIPKGFTQTDMINAECDYSLLIGKGGNLIYNFKVENKLSKKVGLCTLTAKK